MFGPLHARNGTPSAKYVCSRGLGSGFGLICLSSMVCCSGQMLWCNFFQKPSSCLRALERFKDKEREVLRFQVKSPSEVDTDGGRHAGGTDGGGRKPYGRGLGRAWRFA